MNKKNLSERANWQNNSSNQSLDSEKNFFNVFSKYLDPSIYKLYSKPSHFNNIYSMIKLSEDELNKIYNPPINIQNTSWGISPDFAIENIKTHKILFGEIKRQDGWVEKKSTRAGRGNAHERCCKLFAPGLIKIYRETSQIKDPSVLPFWVIFEGDITRDPKRVREITCWFDKFKDNFFMWRNCNFSNSIIEHFECKLKKYID